MKLSTEITAVKKIPAVKNPHYIEIGKQNESKNRSRSL